MAVVYIPSQLRKIAGASRIRIAGATVREVIANLEHEIPALADQLIADGQLVPALQLSIDHVMTRALATSVEAETEVHFLPVIGGG